MTQREAILSRLESGAGITPIDSTKKRRPVRMVSVKKKLMDLTGQRYSRLVVIEEAPSRKRKDKKGLRRYWICRCDCGNTTEVQQENLRSKSVRSCGCFRQENYGSGARRHGATGTPEYRAWYSMVSRCRYSNTKDAHRYKDRGIKVCEEWLKFEAFFADMGKRPSPIHSLDRIDNDGDYTPENCRWATPEEQSNNRANNRYFTYKGKKKTVAQWSREFGVSYSMLAGRLKRGWDMKRSLNQPSKR